MMNQSDEEDLEMLGEDPGSEYDLGYSNQNYLSNCISNSQATTAAACDRSNSILFEQQLNDQSINNTYNQNEQTLGSDSLEDSSIDATTANNNSGDSSDHTQSQQPQQLLPNQRISFFRKKKKKEQQEEHNYNPEWYVNFSHFPLEFQTMEDVLDKYNELGLGLKIQFKRGNLRRDIKGFILQFTIRCYKGAGCRQKIYQGIQLKSYNLTDCPVMAKFKWCPDRMGYLRSRSIRMHHNHPIEIRDKHIINNKQIEDEIKLFIKCKLTVANMHQLINKKFNIKVRYQDVYNMVRNIKRTNEDRSSIKEFENEYESLLEMLNSYKITPTLPPPPPGTALPENVEINTNDQSDNIQYAYELEEDKVKLHPSHLKLENIKNIFIQFKLMKQNYQRFHEILFIDNSIKHKSGINLTELNLILLSGINNEGKNVMFGFALTKDQDYESIKWVLKRFMEFSKHPIRGKIFPQTIITQFDQNLNDAVDKVFSNKSVSLICQNSMKKILRLQFSNLSSSKQNSVKQLYNHIRDVIFTPDAEVFNQAKEVIFQYGAEIEGEENTRNTVSGGVTVGMDTEKLTFLRQVFAIKEKWATAYKPKYFSCDVHCLARADAVTQLISSKLYQRASLIELIKLVEDIDKKIDIRCQQTAVQANFKQFIYNPVFRQLNILFSKFAYEHMIFQSMLSHQCKLTHFRAQFANGFSGEYTVREWIGEYVLFKVRLTFKSGVITSDSDLEVLTECYCDCDYYISFNLICQHIFSVMNVLQLKRIGTAYKLFTRWMRKEDTDDYMNENVRIDNPYLMNISEKERYYYQKDEDQRQVDVKGITLDGHLIDKYNVRINR